MNANLSPKNKVEEEMPSLKDVISFWFTRGTISKFRAKDIVFEKGPQAVKRLGVSIVSHRAETEDAFRQINEEIHSEK